MRHKYVTPAIILGRAPAGESATLLTLLTEELGLLRARADGLRKPGAKLASSLQTFDRSDVTLVRGKEGWRLSGALLAERAFDCLAPAARERAARVTGLLLRLVQGESADALLYPTYARFLAALPDLSEEEQDSAEVFTALRILAALGLDAGDIPDDEQYAPLSPDARRALVLRVNRGLGASGL